MHEYITGYNGREYSERDGKIVNMDGTGRNLGALVNSRCSWWTHRAAFEAPLGRCPGWRLEETGHVLQLILDCQSRAEGVEQVGIVSEQTIVGTATLFSAMLEQRCAKG